LKQLLTLENEKGDDIESEAATELALQATLNHPLVLPIIDIIKDPKGISCFIFPKCEENLE
jgi:hypothetical protein